MIKILDKIDWFANRLLMVIGGIAIMALMAVAVVNITMRILHIPFHGAYELVGFLGAVVVAFALGYTQQRKDHIMVDIVSQYYPAILKRIVNAVRYLLSAGFFVLITMQVIEWGMKIINRGEVSETLKIAFHPFVFAVALGFAMLSFTLTLDFIKEVFGKGAGE